MQVFLLVFRSTSTSITAQHTTLSSEHPAAVCSFKLLVIEYISQSLLDSGLKTSPKRRSFEMCVNESTGRTFPPVRATHPHALGSSVSPDRGEAVRSSSEFLNSSRNTHVSDKRSVDVVACTREKRDRGPIHANGSITILASTNVLARVVGWWTVWVSVEVDLEEREYGTRIYVSII
jgi:hypothetical protein